MTAVGDDLGFGGGAGAAGITGGSQDVVGLTAWQCRELLSVGQISARELTRAYLDRIGLHTVGRFGRYEYLNSDQCMRRAIDLVDQHFPKL